MSSAGSGDEGGGCEEFPPPANLKRGTAFPKSSIGFVPKTEAEEIFNTADHVTPRSKMQKHFVNSDTSAVKSEAKHLAGCSDGKREVSYTDIDVSYSDVKQECLDYCKNADQPSGSLRSCRGAHPSAPPGISGKHAANDNTRGQVQIPQRVFIMDPQPTTSGTVKEIDNCSQNWIDINASDNEMDIDEDEFIVSEHSSNSELEDDGLKVKNEDFLESDSNHFYGKNKFKWAIKEPYKVAGMEHHNITMASPSLRPPAQIYTHPEPDLVWKFLFDEEMLSHIMKWTNYKIQLFKNKFSQPNRPELSHVDMVELKAFLGLLLYSAAFKLNHEDIHTLFATDGPGRDIFSCVMSKERFFVLLNCLRFDNHQDRLKRMESDKAAAISEIFDKFITNCSKHYKIGTNACVDEMLVAFTGRCKWKVHMPNKPNKYGLKVMCLCDSQNSYLCNAYIYCGKGTDGIGLSRDEKTQTIPSQSVLRLINPIVKTNRNITADSWFSSMELVIELQKRQLTYVGALKKNKRHIPYEFLPHKSRKIGDSKFGFANAMTLLSYVPKKSKAVILISSMHHKMSVNDTSGIPEMVEFYNNTKGAVDELDKQFSIYSCNRKTQRWPMAMFYRLLDISGANAHVLYQSYPDTPKIERKAFLENLARKLTIPHMHRRMFNTSLPQELRENIREVLRKRKKRKTLYVSPTKYALWMEHL